MVKGGESILVISNVPTVTTGSWDQLLTEILLCRKVKGGESILVEAEVTRVRDKKPEDKVHYTCMQFRSCNRNRCDQSLLHRRLSPGSIHAVPG